MNKHTIGEKDGADGHAAKKQKVALPTRDEQKQLQQVELLMKSNLIQMEIDQILDEVSGEAVLNKKKVNGWMETVVSLLRDSASFRGVVNTSLNKKTIKKLDLKSVSILSLVNSDDDAMKVEFSAPSAVEVIGSTQHQAALSAMFNIDVAVTMPAGMFEARDILNHRYFDKRRLYLVGLYQTLLKHNGNKDSPLFSKVSFAAFKGDLRKPILVLRAPFEVSRAGAAGVTLRLIPVIAESGVFRAVQLKAGKNNVRPPSQRGSEELSEDQAAALPATPLYNLAVLEDMAVLTQHKILQRTVAPSPALAKALVLLKVWLTQRGLRFTADGFDGHCAGLLLAYLLLTRRVSATGATSALSAFQTALTFIAEGHLLQCRLDFRSADLGPRKPTGPPPSASTGTGAGMLKSNGGAASTEDSAVAIGSDLRHSSVLDDSTWDYKRPLSLIHPLGPQTGGLESCRYNALWRVSASAADMLQSEARRSLRELQQQEPGCFEHLFLQRRSFFERHDHFYHFRIAAAAMPYLENSSIHVVKADAEEDEYLRAVAEVPAAKRKELRNMLLHCPAPLHFAAAAVQIVSRGLGDRATSVHSFVHPADSLTPAEEGDGLPAIEASAHLPEWPASGPSAESDGSQRQSGRAGRDWVVSIGVTLDNEKVDRRVERGPAPSDASIPDIAADPALFSGDNASNGTATLDDELSRFKEFWGPKVQLRRFKDGAIIESVVWDTPTAAGTGSGGQQRVGSVAEQVTRYLLGRHLPAVCGEAGQLVRCVNDQLALQLRVAAAESDSLSRRAVEVLDKLRGVLTSQIKKLPLSFESLMAVAPELRYTALQPPAPHPILLACCGGDGAEQGGDGAGAGEGEAARKGVKRMLKQYAGRTLSLLAAPLRVLVQTETSGKWPLEAEAVRKSKLAMMLRTRAELKSQFQITSIIHEDCLDVCYEGFVFRLQLLATPEVEAVQRAASPGCRGYTPEEVQRAVVRHAQVPPLHHLAVRSLRAQFPSYSGAVRLLSAWAAQHYFSGHLCVELLELLVAYEYLQPFSVAPPASPLAGFYRALLRLGDHNWDADPLIVDLSGEGREIRGNSAVQDLIVAQFRALRDSASAAAAGTGLLTAEEGAADGSPLAQLRVQERRRLNAAMYVVSSADKAHGYWPSLAGRSPERVVLGLIVRAAKVSAERLLAWMQRAPSASLAACDAQDAELDAVMGDDAVLAKCDVVLKFNKTLVNRHPEEGPAFANLTVFANTPAAEVSPSRLIVREAESTAHPVQEEVVKQLRQAFGDSALFFWNSRSGREVGLVWRPAAQQPASFAVLSCRDRAVTEGEGSTTTELNVPQLLSEMLDLSAGLLVQAVEASK